MKYPVAVWEEEGVYSATVPDLPGVITEADSWEALDEEVKEAIAGWMECELDSDRAIPMPRPIRAWQVPPYDDCAWLIVDVDLSALSDKTERINICLPSRARRRLDRLAAKAGESRSGYLAKLIYTNAL